MATKKASKKTTTNRMIVIGERGWVWVGDVSDDGDDWKIQNAKNICVFGTTAGLGQLALMGAQPRTKLGPCGTIRVPKIACIARYDVKEGVEL